MTAYRSSSKAELLPLLLRHGELQAPDARKLDALVGMMKDGAEFSPVRVVVDLGGCWDVRSVDDQYKVAASLMAGFDKIPARIICGPFGHGRRAQ
jgi:hypothetical protein